MNARVDPAIAAATRPRDARGNPVVAAVWAEHVARRRRMMPAGPIAPKPRPRPYAPTPISSDAGPKMVDFADVLKQYREVTLRATRDRTYPPVELILSTTARFFGVQVLDIISVRRTASIVRPRQITAYLAKALTPKSLPEIGRRLGNRDHTTILHACRKIEALARQDAELAEIISYLTEEIELRWQRTAESQVAL